MLAKKHRLKEFTGVFTSGSYVNTPYLSANYKLTSEPVCEFAVITPKKLGDAHIRNKVRRQIGGALQRANLADFQGIKAAISVKKDFVGLDQEQTNLAIAGLIEKIKGILS